MTKRTRAPRPAAKPEVRATVERLRALLKETVPEAEERVYPGWHAFGYRHPEAGYFCGIFPYDDMVKLYFEHGASLPDPEGLLEGEGKQVRWVGVEAIEEARLATLRKLLQAAISQAKRTR